MNIRGKHFVLGLAAILQAVASSASGQPPDGSNGQAATQPPAVITLEEAIHRAQSSEANYAAAVAAGHSARLDRDIAVAGMLPNVHLYSQDIYTQSNGYYIEDGEGQVSPSPKFVANDSRPWEYIAQGLVDETLSLAEPAAVRRANAAAAQAAAEQEVARRGLVAAVVSLFYGSLAADRKLTVAQQAQQEAADFTKLTQEREQARESAHADMVKAQLEEQARNRELGDARVGAEKARLELGVLLFPDPRTPYTLSAPEAAPVLASRDDVNAAAANNNPELKSALSALSASKADVLAARAAYLPDLHFTLAYGIDANEFATRGPLTPSGFQANNLGYSTTATVNLPVWDWLATQHKVKQSEIHREVAQVALTATQRRLIAKLDEAYSEAATARDQLASLDLSVNTAAESLRLTKLAYQGGEATVLEVVDAQGAYVTAQNEREDGRVRYAAALADLQTLTGTM
jgi:outer membrane protein TolC